MFYGILYTELYSLSYRVSTNICNLCLSLRKLYAYQYLSNALLLHSFINYFSLAFL